jgi:hypothetical protein
MSRKLTPTVLLTPFGTQKIGVHYAAVQHQFLRLGVPETTAELTRHSVFDIEIHVHEIRTSLDWFVLDFYVLDIGQPL